MADPVNKIIESEQISRLVNEALDESNLQSISSNDIDMMVSEALREMKIDSSAQPRQKVFPRKVLMTLKECAERLGCDTYLLSKHSNTNYGSFNAYQCFSHSKGDKNDGRLRNKRIYVCFEDVEEWFRNYQKENTHTGSLF